jgi:signal transduction histidine kinase
MKRPKITSEEKLMSLRAEVATPISTIRGHARLLKTIDTKTVKGLPDDFDEWIDAIAEASDKLKKIVDELTGPS